MGVKRTKLYAKTALFTQRIGLSRLSWYCARRAGFFDKPSGIKAESPAANRYIAHRFYMQGYYGHVYPRLLRRLFARTVLHRAWLAGHMGVFEQDGLHHGVTDRGNLQNRK